MILMTGIGLQLSEYQSYKNLRFADRVGIHLASRINMIKCRLRYLLSCKCIDGWLGG